MMARRKLPGWVAAAVGGLAALAGLAVTDRLAGLCVRRDSRAHLYLTVHSDHVDTLVVVFPGLAMPAEGVSGAFAPHVGPTDAMIVVRYPDRGIDLAGITRQLSAEIGRLRPARLRVYGASMGGMCAAEFLSRFRPGPDGPGETVLVLDTAPSGLADLGGLRLPARLLPRYRGGPISSLAWRLACRVYPYPPHESDADPRIIRAAHRAFAATGLPTLTGQLSYLGRFGLATDDRRGWTRSIDRTVFLRGSADGGDPVVAVDSAVQGWRRLLPDLRTVVLARRKDSWHVPIIERPKETMAMIAAV